MQDTTAVTSNGVKDEHANVRFYKMLEVAYNCAKNGYYERASRIATEAAEHYDESFDNR